MLKRIIHIIFIFSVLPAQTVQFNEVMSSNGSTLFDEDGDSPDWIEFYNDSPSYFDLSGFGLTDDEGDLDKWTFPNLILEPNEFMVVFASDKNRTDIIAQWDAVIDWGDQWKYFVGTSDPTSSWKDLSFNDAAWSTGQSGFGYGDGDDNTTISQTPSVFVRKSIYIEDPTIVIKAVFNLDYDDGYVAYLNGQEISRRNMGEPGSPVVYYQTASELHEAEIYGGGFPESIWIDLNEYPLIAGNNVLAIEVHNYNINSSDLSCIPFLTFGYNIIQENVRDPHPDIHLPSFSLHTNFKISSTGENLILSDATGLMVDSVYTGVIHRDISLGRLLEGDTWGIFSVPTPGGSNNTPSYLGTLLPPVFSQLSGFFTNGQTIYINLTSEVPSAEIRFTLDGTEPASSSFLYEYPIPISSNTVVRAKVFLSGWYESKIQSKTYIFEETSPETVPVVFLSTDPVNLFDEDIGIYEMGPNASSDFPHFGSNFWQDWERPIHFEILENDGTGYNANAGVKIFGGWSRGYPQKSMAIFARAQYGPTEFDYPIFPNHNVETYEAFVLRNSGNDWISTMLRDGFITGLADGQNIDHQQYRPSIVYVNGDYWGIFNLREKINEHYIASNHQIDPDQVDLLELDHSIIHGTNTDYLNLLNYIETHDMNDPVVETALENWIDIESYFRYQAIQIFSDNRDWPGNNLKYWRDHRPVGKWRWILFDTDFGFGIWDQNAFTYNTLEFALDPNGPGWPNPSWSTYLYRKMMESDHFKHKFINIYCDMINTVFTSNHLNSQLDDVVDTIVDLIPAHRERWAIPWGGGCCYGEGSVPNWDNDINTMYNFINYRQAYARIHIRDTFGLPNIAMVSLESNPEGSGSIQINSLEISESNWNGYYFPAVPITVKANPKDGYDFLMWAEFPDSSAEMTISISDPFYLTALFQPNGLEPGTIVINEINYNSSDDFDPEDWIELHNPGETAINITGWAMKDDDNEHVFVIPEETIIEPGEYLVLAKDLGQFIANFPNVNNVIGSFEFGLSGGGDQVRIYNTSGILTDSVEYDDNSPWPVEPDGNGPTLELINPLMENTEAASWCGSVGNGTPGAQNSCYEPLSISDDNSIATTFSLEQNYPNPFNPSTNIQFDLSVPSHAELTIYDVTGREINHLLNTHLRQGRHSVQWNGQDQFGKAVSAGLYFYQLRTEKFTQTKKMLLLK